MLNKSANSSFDQLYTLIDQQIDSQETLCEYLTKAHALAQVAVGENFLDHSKPTIYGHLWALEHLIEQAKQLCEQLVNALLQGRPSETETPKAASSAE